MVALTAYDRIAETVVNPGAGDIPLSGAIDTTHMTVSSRFADTDKGPFSIFGGSQWMTFEGTYNLGANTLTRTRVIDGSSGLGTNVSFGTGTYTVICGLLGNQLPLGRQMVPIPAGGMKANTTNGAVPGSVEMTTNLEMFVTLDFDPNTAQSAMFAFPMPASWDLGPVSFKPVWSHPATTTNFGVVFELAGIALSDGDAGDAAFGTGQTSIDTGGTTNTIYIGAESAAITIGGTPASGDLVFFRIKRLPANASDTMAVNARLHAIQLFINTLSGHD